MGKTRAASSTDSPGVDDSQLTKVNDALVRQEAMFLKMLDVQQKHSNRAVKPSWIRPINKFLSENIRTQAGLRANLISK